MSVYIPTEAYEHGLAMIHDRLVDGVKAYKDYLVTFGTAPSMELVERLQKDIDLILSFDLGCNGESITPFRQTATGLIYPAEINESDIIEDDEFDEEDDTDED